LFLKIFIVHSIVLLSSCQKTPEIITAADIEQWFVSPSDSRTRELSLQPIQRIDSLVKSIRTLSVPGTFSDTLTDSTGSRYILGYCTPHEFTSGTVYPLVIYLHGGTGTAVSNKGEKAYEMLRPLTDSMPLFLASPSADRSARWWSADGMNRILQTIRFMTLHYPIDTKKIFLAGVSDGATGCWIALNTITGPFAGFFAISGFGGMLPSMGIELYPPNMVQRPIYNVNAGKDQLYSIDIVTNFLDYMQSQGLQLNRMVYPDEQHGFDYREKEFGTLCRFIRTWKQPQPDTVSWIFSAGLPNRPQTLIDWEFGDASNNRFVNIVFSKDTISISSQGISSVTLAIPPASKYNFLKAGTKGVRKLSSTTTTYLQLKVMIQRSDPINHTDHFYRISL